VPEKPSTMERGRFTPRTWRIDYRLRFCVPSCVALRLQLPQVSVLPGRQRTRKAFADGCCWASVARASDGTAPTTGKSPDKGDDPSPARC
jgi:hypothetical protein